jgi:hypothetical protein
MKIQKINKEHYEGAVYNIGTLPDHNYFVEGILAHNCYMDAQSSGKHVDNVVEKLHGRFGSLTANQRPFQVALGGNGNPNEHPDFIKILSTFDELGITPNYTTNGMGLSKAILKATKEYCGGVAVSCHPHLETTWKIAARKLINMGISTSLHHIISDKDSVDKFLGYLTEWPDIKYHVLLPLIGQGRATGNIPVENEYLFTRLLELPEDVMKKVAFGAKFFPELTKRRKEFNVSLYEPESMSKYYDMMTGETHGSSFEA